MRHIIQYLTKSVVALAVTSRGEFAAVLAEIQSITDGACHVEGMTVPIKILIDSSSVTLRYLGGATRSLFGTSM